MNKVKFPALIGDSPLAILAAIGTTRLIHDFIDGKAQLAWDEVDYCPVLFSVLPTVTAVTDAIRGIIMSMPEGSVVPSAPVGFPPPGEAPDKLRVQQGKLPGMVAELLTGSSDSEKATVFLWLGSLITDLAVDGEGRGAVSQFISSAGKQSIATMLEKPLQHLRREPDYIRQALVSWRRISGVTGENLDHRAAWNANEDGKGKASMRGVPGATWLALMSYSLWTTTAARKRPRTSGWHSVRMRHHSIQELRLPLWEEPLSPAGIKALVEHPALEGEPTLPLSQEIRLLKIFHICRARRYKSPSCKSAGILKPLAL